MENIMDYLDWRGDLSFEQAPLNEVDNLILAMVSYVELDGIVPTREMGGSITLADAAAEFEKGYDESYLEGKIIAVKTSSYLFMKMAKTRRFQNLKLFNYVNDIDDNAEKQFSALCIELMPGLIYVSFSGTDSSVAGWKEDMNLGYLTSTPGQQMAIDYMNRLSYSDADYIYVGGHSKGGNFAVYSSVKCDSVIRQKIVRVYNNDGPGFLDDMLNSPEYNEMLPKIITIVPNGSMVGILLGHREEYNVIKSSAFGLMQHSGMTWEVKGPAFVKAAGLDETSEILDETLKNWLSAITVEERREFVNAIFELIDAAGIDDFEDLGDLKLKNLANLLNEFGDFSKKKKEMLMKIMKLFREEALVVVKTRTREKTMQRLIAKNSEPPQITG